MKTIRSYYWAWLLISLFYFYQYILRISPGIMVVELRHQFLLTAQEFSSLGSIYLLSYSLLQVPLGFILDRLGVKRVTVAAIGVCLLGTITFAYADELWQLQLGRFLIGLGSAPAFICALKLVHDHLPVKYSGLLMGATLAIGTFGALLSGKFLVAILETTSWQHTLLLCAGLGGLLAMIIVAIIPKRQQLPSDPESHWSQFRLGISAIFQQKQLLLYSMIAIGLYTPLCVLADLWGTAFLMQKYTLTRATAAQLSLYLYGGLTIGSLLLPWMSQHWRMMKQTIQGSAIGLLLMLGILLYANYLSITQLSLVLISIGVFCGAEMICFAGAAQHSPAAHSGLALGVVNTLNMLGGGLVQQLIGWYLDWEWKGAVASDGARFYGASELTAAFSMLLVIIFGCLILARGLCKD